MNNQQLFVLLDSIHSELCNIYNDLLKELKTIPAIEHSTTRQKGNREWKTSKEIPICLNDLDCFINDLNQRKLILLSE